MVLIGNKSDLGDQRQVSTQEGMEAAKTFRCKYIETSAKNRTNVDEAFYTLIREINSNLVPVEEKKKKRINTKKCLIL